MSSDEPRQSAGPFARLPGSKGPAARTTPLTRALERLGPHGHLCSIADSQEEYVSVAVSFIRFGLERGDNCVYIADDDTKESTRQAMAAGGIDVEGAVAAGALVWTTREQVYLKHGSFNPGWMSTFWEETIRQAIDGGFPAVRAAAETGWVLTTPGHERWAEYESRLTQTISDYNCVVLCQYHRHRFPAGFILDAIRTHPIVVHRGMVCRNMYHVPSGESLEADQAPREVERLLANLLERAQVEDALRRHRHAEEALRQTRDELARVARALSLGELATSIAHEVSQPLAAIVTSGNACLRWLDRTEPDVAEARRAAESIVRDGIRASEVIARARTFLQRGESPRTLLSLDGVIDEVVSLVQGEARDHEVSIRARCDADLPLVAGDRVQLQQVLLNLMLNAIEAMSRTKEGARVLEIEAHAKGADAVRVVVRDSGPGLDLEHIERLFDAFYTTRPKGIGMGLAISRSTIEAHGGRLWATPNPGPGAMFQFVLPVAKDSGS
jgi:signal transduction histidine kinase